MSDLEKNTEKHMGRRDYSRAGRKLVLWLKGWSSESARECFRAASGPGGLSCLCLYLAWWRSLPLAGSPPKSCPRALYPPLVSRHIFLNPRPAQASSGLTRSYNSPLLEEHVLRQVESAHIHTDTTGLKPSVLKSVNSGFECGGCCLLAV